MVVRSRVVRLRDVPQLLSAHRCHSNEQVALPCSIPRTGHWSIRPPPSRSIIRFGWITHDVESNVSTYGHVRALTRAL